MSKFSLDTSECTMTIWPPNKYHKDDIINEFLEWVRHTKLEDDAINNIPIVLKWYERRKIYTFKEKIKILFNL